MCVAVFVMFGWQWLSSLTLRPALYPERMCFVRGWKKCIERPSGTRISTISKWIWASFCCSTIVQMASCVIEKNRAGRWHAFYSQQFFVVVVSFSYIYRSKTAARFECSITFTFFDATGDSLELCARFDLCCSIWPIKVKFILWQKGHAVCILWENAFCITLWLIATCGCGVDILVLERDSSPCRSKPTNFFRDLHCIHKSYTFVLSSHSCSHIRCIRSQFPVGLFDVRRESSCIRMANC